MEQDQQQVRNLRDFLLVYNRMTEICFQRCTSNLNYRNLTMDEEHCVDSCAGKLIRSNHRLMGTYVQLLPALVQRRLDEMAAKSGQMAKAAEAGANGETLPLATAELVEGTVAESPPLFTQPSAEAEIPPVIAPSTGGATVELPPAFAPPTVGETVQIPPIPVPASAGIAKEPAPMLVPATSAIPALSEMVKSLPEPVSTPPAPVVQKLPLPQQIDPPSLSGSSQSSPTLSSGPSVQPGPDFQSPSQPPSQ